MAMNAFLERHKLDVTQKLAGSTCNEKQRQAASKTIDKGNTLLTSLNLPIDTNLKRFIIENRKIWQVSASYLVAHNILDDCKED